MDFTPDGRAVTMKRDPHSPVETVSMTASTVPSPGRADVACSADHTIWRALHAPCASESSLVSDPIPSSTAGSAFEPDAPAAVSMAGNTG